MSPFLLEDELNLYCDIFLAASNWLIKCCSKAMARPLIKTAAPSINETMTHKTTNQPDSLRTELCALN